VAVPATRHVEPHARKVSGSTDANEAPAKPANFSPLVQRLKDRVRGEYLEVPGLGLTRVQAQRFFGLGHEKPGVLDVLVRDGFLSCNARGEFVRA
jgi:hypothetical protein